MPFTVTPYMFMLFVDAADDLNYILMAFLPLHVRE
jgi:hypothetical protein